MELKVVHFDPKSDTVLGIYIDDKLIEGGDEYHNNITVWLKAFLRGISVTGKSYTVNNLYTKKFQMPVDYFSSIDFESEG
jgi:hypothetical protein